MTEDTPFLLRPDDDGNFDEFFADGVDVHMEMMDKDCLWIGCTRPDGSRWSVWISANKSRLSINAFEDGEPTDAGRLALSEAEDGSPAPAGIEEAGDG